MDEQGNGAGPARGPIETAVLAGLGWASLTAQAADDLADELARLVGIDRDELRRAVRDVFASWRRDAERAGFRREDTIDRLIAKLRLVQREEADDLVLRIAQLEHRVGLLEAGD
jgi:polyhydroxyalkanoate synthesis regulator phasin